MDELQYRALSIRIDALDKRYEEMQERLDELKVSTDELISILQSFRQAVKTLEFIGKVAKPIGAIIGLAAAVWGAFHIGDSR